MLDDWQRHILSVALGERSDGKWAAFEVGLIVGRQNGKGAVLEARELAGLFLFGEQLILHSAHEFKTAQEAFRRVLALVQNTPDLERLVSRVRTSHGEEGIELRSGARLRFVARSTGSGRGFSGDVVPSSGRRRRTRISTTRRRGPRRIPASGFGSSRTSCQPSDPPCRRSNSPGSAWASGPTGG
jgi:hypothetical protein